MPTLDLPDCRLHYRDAGDGAPLLLIHGNFASHQWWEPQFAAPPAGRRLIAPDLRGHGDSAWSQDGTYMMANYIYDLAQLVHQQAMAPVTIVAHSLGTIVAYTALRDFQLDRPGVKVPLLITVGSPLGAHQVKARIGPPWAVPGNVADWSNYYDKGDPVTLGRALARDFAVGISDHVVNNQTTNGHSIEGYLDEAQIVAKLAAVL